MGAAAGRARLNTSPETGTHTARAYAQALLDSLGVAPLRALDLPDEHPALSWARSGLMALTGFPDSEPRMCPVPLAACADGTLAALASLAPPGAFGNLRGSRLLAERAALAGYTRNGATSPGGSCRLLPTPDGVIALNLAREDDWALLPAWLECEVPPDWESVAAIVHARPATELVARARELGLALAMGSDPVTACHPERSEGSLFPGIPRCARNDNPTGSPLVVDLSSLWAGPLCSHLLQRCGAEVIKVESLQRPDGARRGPPEFFDRLNTGKRSLALDFSTPQGRDSLRELLARADIVIEGSRPRALRQLGIQAEELVTANPRLTWISLTGYGRSESQANWIAYGDDAAVAAGLSQVQFQATGEWMFVGDAIADPLTGLHAALAAWAGWQGGGAGLIALALRDVVSHCIHFDLPRTPGAIRERQREWTARAAAC